MSKPNHSEGIEPGAIVIWNVRQLLAPPKQVRGTVLEDGPVGKSFGQTQDTTNHDDWLRVQVLDTDEICIVDVDGVEEVA